MASGATVLDRLRLAALREAATHSVRRAGDTDARLAEIEPSQCAFTDSAKLRSLDIALHCSDPAIVTQQVAKSQSREVTVPVRARYRAHLDVSLCAQTWGHDD
jgi:hypothetical protein